MGVGPSRAEEMYKSISKLPSPTLVFPGYYHMESRFFANKEELRKLCREIMFETLQVPFAATIFNFLSSEYSIGKGDLQVINTEKNVLDQLNTFIKSEVDVIRNAFRLLESADLTDTDRTSYLINGIAGCNKIVNLFSNQECYLFKHPLVSAPILINIVPLYMNLVMVRYKETKSHTVRDDLDRKITHLKGMVVSHMDRAITDRLRHVRGEMCTTADGSFYVYYDHIFPKKLELLSVWYPEESFGFRYQLSGNDMDEIIGHYKDDVEKVYNSYFETAVGMISEATELFRQMSRD